LDGGGFVFCNRYDVFDRDIVEYLFDMVDMEWREEVMKAYEIEGWLSGIKIRRVGWDDEDLWIKFSASEDKWVDCEGNDCFELRGLFSHEDWEKYVEGKRKVKMLAYLVDFYSPSGYMDTLMWFKDGWEVEEKERCAKKGLTPPTHKYIRVQSEDKEIEI